MVCCVDKSIPGWLDARNFATVLAAAPLIAIDLLVENDCGEYLLGLRKNAPAQDWWFVPGGRVLKGEALDEAFRRLTYIELGREYERHKEDLRGVYEHFYENSIAGEHISTHYIVLAYRVKLAEQYPIALDSRQHKNMLWVKPQDMRALNVHHYTLAYFE